jgi:hypothetical protein
MYDVLDLVQGQYDTPIHRPRTVCSYGEKGLCLPEALMTAAGLLLGSCAGLLAARRLSAATALIADSVSDFTDLVIKLCFNGGTTSMGRSAPGRSCVAELLGWLLQRTGR